MFLLDTDIAIHLRDGFEPVLQRRERHNGAMAPSSPSYAELQRGLSKSPRLWSFRKAQLEAILRTIVVLPFDSSAAEAHGTITGQIGWARGRDFARRIAAHAIATGRVLVTANSSDFSDIPGLTLEDWTG